MIAIERRNTIKKILFKRGSVKVSDLVKQFNVSEETIRRDLNQLEKEGLVEKNYGGAILRNTLVTTEFNLPIRQRQQHHSKEKELIGIRAAELVEPEQTLILDAGSTVWHLARNLARVDNLMIITNAMNIAEECIINKTASIYLLGGKLRRNSLSLVGPQAELELQNYSADYVFLGASAVSRKGFMSTDLYEAQMKKAMVATGKKVVVLADHSKFDKSGLTSFCDFKDINILITSDGVEQEILKKIEDAGVEVIVVTSKRIK